VTHREICQYAAHFSVRTLVIPALSVGILCLLTACPRTQTARVPERHTVAAEQAKVLGEAQASLSAPEYIAAVRANEETDFSFKVGGTVERIGPQPRQEWDEGTQVKAGTVLARLQQGDFKNALASAKAADDLAVANNERLRKLLSGSVISKQEFDKSNADRDTARAHLQQALQDLADTELRAPWNGVVFARYVNSGETVSAGKPVLRFGDIHAMSVELGVPDGIVDQFVVGHQIDVDISALAGRPPFRGTISEVGVAANNAGRLYRVVIKVPNPAGVIRSGMTATVRVGAAHAGASQVLVPLSALIAPSSPAPAPGKPPTQLAVFVVRDGRATLRRIVTGDVVASSIIVSEGLQAGDEVVTKGASQLYDGALVDVR
jgi:RND family efflux transporter MFP subunit